MKNLLTNFFKKETPELAIVEPVKMGPQHMHTWVLTAQTFAPPISLNIKDSNISDTAFLEKASFGVTTLLWECDKCSATKKEEMLGSENDTLEELVKKVKLTGPQYIERDGETYIFNKYIPITSYPGNIPIR